MVDTPQLTHFKDNIAYAREMVGAGHTYIADRESDIYRAAWIQAVAALDHWVHEELYQRATHIAMNTQAERSNRFNNFAIPWHRVEEINNANRPLREVFREALEDKYGHASFQSTEHIGAALSLVAGQISTSVLWKRTARRMDESGDYPGIEGKAMIEQHDGVVVKRRNQISHASDIDPLTRRRRPISSAETQETIRWIESFVGAIHGTLSRYS